MNNVDFFFFVREKNITNPRFSKLEVIRAAYSYETSTQLNLTKRL